jgi:hypothetical protein
MLVRGRCASMDGFLNDLKCSMRRRESLLPHCRGHVFSIGVLASIFDEHNRVLLCRRRDVNLWNLPGGGVEKGELPTETAVS